MTQRSMRPLICPRCGRKFWVSKWSRSRIIHPHCGWQSGMPDDPRPSERPIINVATRDDYYPDDLTPAEREWERQGREHIT